MNKLNKTLRQKLRHVRWRCSVNRLLVCTVTSMGLAAVVAFLAVAAERILATGWISAPVVAAVAAAGALTALVRWQLTRPTAMHLAVLLDERAGLRERTSTTVAFTDADDPFARAAVRESQATIDAVQPARHFPIQPPRHGWLAPATWALVILGWLVLPQGDLLGKLAAKKEQQQKQAQLRKTKAQAHAAVQQVKALSEKLDKALPPETFDHAAEQIATAQDPQQVRRLAFRHLADLQNRVQQTRADAKFQGLKQLQQKLRQLRSPHSGLTREFAAQLARGQFGKAAASLQNLRKALNQENLTDQQRKQLAAQLDAVAKQLKTLSKQQWRMKNELKKLGLDPKLAGDLKKLDNALKSLPLTDAQKKKLLDLAQANRQACRSCGGLGKALSSAAAGMAGTMNDQSAQALADAADQLGSLEALSQQLQLSEASLAELSQTLKDLQTGTCSACKGRGCTLCNGTGMCSTCSGSGCGLCAGKGPWRAGQSQKQSAGMGGPGRGRGQVADIEPTDYQLAKTRAQTKTQAGPTIASWYVQGQQVKGESRKTFADVTRNAEQRAAEAIRDERIPKEYHQAIKQYFGALHHASNDEK